MFKIHPLGKQRRQPDAAAGPGVPLKWRALACLTRSRLGRAAMKPFLNKYLTSAIRHGLTKLAGILSGIGIITLNGAATQEAVTNGAVEIALGLVMWLIPQVWSWADKAKNQAAKK